MEYLILVCLIAVSTIAIVTIVGQNIKARYANISNALRGKQGLEKLVPAEEESYRLRDFEDFMESAKRPEGGMGWGE